MRGKLLLLAFMTIITMAHAQIRSDNTLTVAETIKQNSIDWMLALDRKDFKSLENFVAPDFTLGGVGDGETVDRATWLKNAEEIGFSKTHYHFLDIHMRSDSVAIVNSKFSFRPDRLPFKITSNLVDTWVYRDERWQVTQRLVGSDSLTNLMNMAKGFLLGVLITIFFFSLRKRIILRNRKRLKKDVRNDVKEKLPGTTSY